MIGEEVLYKAQQCPEVSGLRCTAREGLQRKAHRAGEERSLTEDLQRKARRLAQLAGTP